MQKMHVKSFVCLLMSGLSMIGASLYAQKPLITNSIERFEGIQAPHISDNGDYVLYSIHNEPLNSQTVVLQSTTDLSMHKYVGAKHPSFADHSHYFVFMNAGDSLVVLNLKNFQISYYPDVRGYEELPND